MIALLRQGRRSRRRRGRALGGMRMHRVASKMMTELGASSKLNAEWAFFSFLREEGRKAGARVPGGSRDRISASARPSIIDVLLEGI